MSNSTETLRGLCPTPFFQSDSFPAEGGFIEGRLCQEFFGIECCLPCPMTDWVYPDNFGTLTQIADWVSVAGTLSCVFLLLSWLFLPVEKTNRHYLSICLCCAVLMMNFGFIIPLAARPEQCFNEITPNGMHSSNTCAASGAFLLFGGFSGVMWVFLRSVSLHLQICWQLNVGVIFMWVAQAAGWLVPLAGLILALVFSGVSFRFGTTCHINHENSLADFWIPLLVFAGLTVILSFATFGYCIKVYLDSLADNGPSTEGSGLPSYTNSVRTLTPRQAYRRIRRVIALQWRGITIVLIIIADVIFFSIVFVFQDNTIANLRTDPTISADWVTCLLASEGDKAACLSETGGLAVPEATVVVVLLLLALNGIWLLFLLGRWSMFTGWMQLFKSLGGRGQKTEFVSVDARIDYKSSDTRSYEMLSRDSGKTLETIVTPNQGFTPTSGAFLPASPTSGRRTPDYFSEAPAPTARYKVPARSFNSPQPPQSRGGFSSSPPPPQPRGGFSTSPPPPQSRARFSTSPPPAQSRARFSTSPPPAQSRFSPSPPPQARFSPSPPPPTWDPQQTYARPNQQHPQSYEEMNPLGMNRI
ncbi:uncharacterized protein MKZ38_008643 [Zalerion maritima]|uniref:G-protein coupled receptors family 2 profile 2 domain-containing protein n=1 Tax=Zalerion maritima TaxID=339359 RepID=A0AAD5S050_9PEZI|nr:uncharacterized protein MKZ38_008643 [Zalerion maritima]